MLIPIRLSEANQEEGGVPEWSLIELNGTLNSSGGADISGLELGQLSFAAGGKVSGRRADGC